MHLAHRVTSRTSSLGGGDGGDRVRQGVVLLAAAAQLAVPWVLRRSDPRRLGRPSADVVPAPATFAVWAPIMGLGAVHGAAQARPGRAAAAVPRAAGWLTAAAFASTGAWAPLVVRARWWPAQAAITSIGICAAGAGLTIAGRERDRGRLPAEDRWLHAVPVGMLAGWGGAAAGVNLASMLVGQGLVARGRPERAVAATTIAALAAVGAAGVRTAGAGTTTARAFGATVVWALGGIAAAQRRRWPAGAALAATGAAAVLGVLARPLVRAR